MTFTWRPRIACVMLGLAAAAASAPAAHAERWPGTTASIGGAIAARVIAVKCAGHLSPPEIAELDTYIDARQAAFMSASAANRRLAESVFPRIAREYDYTYKRPEACTTAARDMARDMLARVRADAARERQAGLAD